MRSNRPSYAATPAGSAKALDQKPKPKRSKREINQLMLMLLFVILPVIGLLAIFFQPVRWIFMLCVVAAIAAMWLMRAFLFPGRMIVTAIYGLLLVFALVTALSEQNTSAIRQQQNPLLSISAAATSTPAFSVSTMGTNVPDTYYADPDADALDGLQTVGLSGGSVDETGLDSGSSDSGASAYVSAEKSGAEIVLENFMEKWRKGSLIADMVEYTAPSWRASLSDTPSQQLFWKFAQRPLEDWRQMSAPTGTDASTARTITVQADVTYSGAVRTYQYDAIMLYEEEAWYVDPNSLSSGILVEQATPTPDPNITPTPTPEPTPTPAPSSKTKLYYNKDGGKYYHADQNCKSVNSKYLPLKGSFTYGDIKKSPYSALQPCKECDAPARP